MRNRKEDKLSKLEKNYSEAASMLRRVVEANEIKDKECEILRKKVDDLRQARYVDEMFKTADGYFLKYSHDVQVKDVDSVKAIIESAELVNMMASVEPIRVEGDLEFSPRYTVHLYHIQKATELLNVDSKA